MRCAGPRFGVQCRPLHCHVSHILCHCLEVGTAELEQTASMGKVDGGGNLCSLLGEKLPWSTGASWVLARCIPERSHPCAPFLRLSGSTNAALVESQSQVSFESCFCQSKLVSPWE